MIQNFAAIESNGLYAQNLKKIYGKRTVVHDISLHIHAGEVVGLLGPNGAGKTTTFSMIVGLVKPNLGRVILDKQDVTKLPMYKRARKGLGYLPQELSIFKKLSVENNIKAVLEIQGKSKAEINKRTDALIKQLRIEHVRKQMAYTLSGGEKRRVEVARILAIEPRILLLDEPFTGIDPIAIADIQSIVLQLRKELGLGILITDHNVRETLKIVDRAYICYNGEILFSGTNEELINNEEAKRVYLGSDFSL